MRAKLKYLHSPDIDLENFSPKDFQNFSFLLQAMIGPENEEGYESFDILVCTPKWIEEALSKERIMWGRHLLLVDDYNLSVIKQFISRFCERCLGDNWSEIAQKLSRFGAWEFEDYQDYKK